MKKRVLSCLTALVLLVTLAFSVSALCPRAYVADAIAPYEDVQADDGSGTVVTEESNPETGSPVKAVLICVVIGLVIALIVTMAVKSGYKPVQRKRDAAQYLVDGSLRITASGETLVRTDVSERTIENKNG